MGDSTGFYRWRPHPWHGLEAGRRPPRLVHAYIEITTFDVIKYEVDKTTGYLRVDRPQRTSSQPPALYGFIPQTYCAERVRKLSPNAARGDGDPLDICVLSERAFNRAEVIVNAKVVGGLQVVDGGEADDKIVAVMENDYFFGGMEDLSELPDIYIERLRHYFRANRQPRARQRGGRSRHRRLRRGVLSLILAYSVVWDKVSVSLSEQYGV
jgi:inorganic pyrophosphatase